MQISNSIVDFFLEKNGSALYAHSHSGIMTYDLQFISLCVLRDSVNVICPIEEMDG